MTQYRNDGPTHHLRNDKEGFTLQITEVKRYEVIVVFHADSTRSDLGVVEAYEDAVEAGRDHAREQLPFHRPKELPNANNA